MEGESGNERIQIHWIRRNAIAIFFSIRMIVCCTLLLRLEQVCIVHVDFLFVLLFRLSFRSLFTVRRARRRRKSVETSLVGQCALMISDIILY